MLDVRTMSAGVAQARTVYWLAGMHRRAIGADGSEPPSEMRVVTGLGKLTEKAGRSPMREAISTLLQTMGSPFKALEDNPGLLSSSGVAMWDWLKDTEGLGLLLEEMCGGEQPGVVGDGIASLLDPTLIPISFPGNSVASLHKGLNLEAQENT